MAGLKISIPAKFTDATLPVLKDDPLLTRGSLALLDPTHPASPWTSGVPSRNQRLPNIAASSLSDISGVISSHPDVAGSFDIGLGWLPAHGKTVRSAKGGINVTPTRSIALPREAYQGIALPKAAMQHLFENQDHEYYTSQWVQITTPEGAGYPAYGFIGNVTTEGVPSPARLLVWQQSDRPMGASPKRTGGAQDAYPSLGNKFRFTAVKGISKGNDDADAVLTSNPKGFFGWGNWSIYITAAGHGLPGYTIFRQYFEDLTVSGRTYSEVHAIDKALYTKEVLTTGGRYYGDTVPA